MKTFKLYKIVVLASLLMLSACQKESFILTGHITGYKDGTRVKLASFEDQSEEYYTTLNNNSFTFQGPANSEPEKFILTIDNGKNLPADYCSLFIKDEILTINADKKDFPYHVNISGSKEQEAANSLNGLLAKDMEDRDKISDEYFALSKDIRATDSIKELYDGKNGKFTKVENRLEATIKDFIRKNYNTVAALDYFLILREKFDSEEIEAIYNKMDVKAQNSRNGKAIKEYVEAKKVNPGSIVYNFEAKDQHGKTHQMHDYLNKDKYILLEFSSPGCGWCKKAIPMLEEISKEQKNKLEVVSLTTIIDSKGWEKINKTEKISYTRLNNNEGRYGRTTMRYAVNATPTFILISPEGRMLKKIEGYNEKLKDSIYPLLK
ncbi:DUF4369 domain-containing protein [Flavobacterium hauense]